MTAELLVRSAFAERERLQDQDVRVAVQQVIEALDHGAMRVAEFTGNSWIVHDWIQQAILLYFALREATAIEAGPLSFWDKVPMKKSWSKSGVRVVPPGVARYGSFLAPGVI